MSDRAAYTAGLRALADLLDENEHIPLPFTGSSISRLLISHLRTDDDTRAAFVKTVRSFPGAKAKTADSNYFDVNANLHGLHVQISTYRDTVCTRTVTGTKTVTRDVPDADALAAVPTTQVTETIETVEWICDPLLSGPTEAGA